MILFEENAAGSAFTMQASSVSFLCFFALMCHMKFSPDFFPDFKVPNYKSYFQHSSTLMICHAFLVFNSGLCPDRCTCSVYHSFQFTLFFISSYQGTSADCVHMCTDWISTKWNPHVSVQSQENALCADLINVHMWRCASVIANKWTLTKYTHTNSEVNFRIFPS